MQSSTTPTTRPGNPAPFRELSPAETDHVSGGLVPVLLLAAAVTVALMESCSDGNDSDDGGEQSED